MDSWEHRSRNKRHPNEGLELYFTQQPDDIGSATFMEQRMRRKNESGTENMNTCTDGKRAPSRLHNIFINVELIKILFKDLAENEKNAESAPRGLSEM